MKPTRGGIFIGKWTEFSSQVPLWHNTPCPTCELGLVLLCKARFFSCFVAIKAPSSDKSAFTLQKTPRKWNPFRDDTTLLAIQVVSSSTFIIVLTLQRDWRNKIDTFCFAFQFLSNLKIWIPILFAFYSSFHCLTSIMLQCCTKIGISWQSHAKLIFDQIHILERHLQ